MSSYLLVFQQSIKNIHQQSFSSMLLADKIFQGRDKSFLVAGNNNRVSTPALVPCYYDACFWSKWRRLNILRTVWSFLRHWSRLLQQKLLNAFSIFIRHKSWSQFAADITLSLQQSFWPTCFLHTKDWFQKAFFIFLSLTQECVHNIIYLVTRVKTYPTHKNLIECVF